MKRSGDHERMRAVLMDSTAAVVAKYGVEGCTSKKVALESQLNESYIFRYFIDLKDLREKTFLRAEERFLFLLGKLLKEYPDEGDADARKQKIFEAFWSLLSEEREKVLFFVRYYFSGECYGDVFEHHLDNCRLFLLSRLCPEDEIEQKARMGSALLVTVLQYATEVARGVLEDDGETRNLVLKNLI